ncbi:DNA-processing protein DprA [Isoptericola jiangsuensis]|uniref:DNA-processing protein DprA n=1 Tax=Isoptericola jiangsuensis TaxID=548579 RepID=UPI000BF49783|nr:DNA-processing protein DprA [Isoptericola jiangsuensis]
MTTQAVDQAAATVALLRAKVRGHGWNSLATEIWYAGDAVRVWKELVEGDSLVPDPRDSQLLDEARDDVLRWEKDGLRFLTVLDPDFPSRLRDIREVPPFLFAEGALVPEDRGMSVVGSRKASERGHQIAGAAAELLVSKGLTVIAGLAAGVDTAAHRAALAVGGRTAAFIGTGITRAYPATNRKLQAEIGRRGLVLSQFWPDAEPSKSAFPIRNTAMSGYGMGTIVVEAGETSGTRIQARVAVEHGRPVILTDMVAERTQWGAALVGRPGVHVVTGIDDLDKTIDEVLDAQASLALALEAIGSVAPTAA